MAKEGKLIKIATTQDGKVNVETAAGVFGDVLAAGLTEYPDVASFIASLDDAEAQFVALLPLVPLFLERRKQPGNVAALLGLAGKRVVFDTDPGQTTFSFPA